MPHKVAGARTCGDQYLDQTQSFVQKDPKFLGVLYNLCPLILGFCTNWGGELETLSALSGQS